MRVYAHFIILYLFVGLRLSQSTGLIWVVYCITHGFLYLGFRGRTQIKWMTSFKSFGASEHEKGNF